MKPSEFQAWFPRGEFSSLPDNFVQSFIDRAVPAFNKDRWGAWYPEGFSHYVAHLIIVDKVRAANDIDSPIVDIGGNIQTKTKGPVSVTYSPALLTLAAQDSLYLTPYGRRVVELRKLVGIGGIVVR